jgi:protein O-mannosyl-transferase
MGARRVSKVVETRKSPAAAYKYVWAGLALAFCAALFIYGPALTGPFVYDDAVQRYAKIAEANESLGEWLKGLRPLLSFSFWLNHAIFGDKPLGYHVVNVLIHVLNSALVFLITQKLLSLYRTSDAPRKLNLLAGFTAAVFLLHPIQTESVAYIASRSETLSAFFMLAALALFLYRPPGPITWPTAACLVLLALAACATKEHAVVLAPVLLLADLFWNADLSLAGVRKNWRLYMPLGIAGVVGGAIAMRVVGESLSAGFRLREFTWVEYFLTECRVFFSYIRLLFLPVGQTLGHDVPISRNLLDHGAIFGLAGILALIAASVYFRRRYRLASFGILLFIVLLAPTSSFIPLLEPQVEHRLYLPALALTWVAVEFLLRARVRQGQLAAICISISCVFAVLTYVRNQVWGSDVSLWADTLAKAPNTKPPYYNLAIAYIAESRCGEAENVLQRASLRFDNDPLVLTLWGRADECLAKFDEAANRLTQAAELTPRASLYIRIGIVRARQGKSQEAYDAFERAIELDPSSKQAYILRGEWYEAAERFESAISDFRRALELTPDDTALRDRVEKMEQRLRLSGSVLVAPGNGAKDPARSAN